VLQVISDASTYQISRFDFFDCLSSHATAVILFLSFI